MRIIKGPDGSFQIIDEYMQVSGEDAERILAEMDKPPTEAQQKFAAECVAIYQRNMSTLVHHKVK